MGTVLTSHEPPSPDPAANRLEPKAQEHLVDLAEPLGYRIKKRLLGPPLHSERLAHERLGKPTALAVFASDNLSSSAYATEEILRVLVPVVGVAAFSLVVPITIAMLVVLGFLILSYRQTIKAYPSAGGAYIVTRDNFGLLPAQVAGVALLTDYILTVSVSVAAGSAALASAFHVFSPYLLPISVGFVLLIAGLNLKGVKESGKIFAVPTYFFIVNMGILMAIGFFKAFTGGLAHQAPPADPLSLGIGGNGLLYGATLYVVLHAFASGGAAVTGVEAISNGVPAFKEPAWKNARTTLVIMGSTLGAMFLALSWFASKLHTIPSASGTPTVISQIGDAIYGGGAGGRILFFALQAGTMLILVLAANTSFADFPRLASFHAGDNFMPRQLTKRGHRLVFSNGIIALAATAILLLVVTNAQVDRLIPLYAIGVFLSFTLSQAGMARHHITQREPKWRTGLFINGMGSLLSGIVCVVIAATKFTEGAWVIIVLIPILVALLMRLNRQYETEERILRTDAPAAAEAPVRPRQVVMVLVDRLDVAAARAIQSARSMAPEELMAVHFDLDPIRTDELTEAWTRLGLSRLPLDVIDCPDRRLDRAAAELAARQLADGRTEVTVLLPRLVYSRFWHRLVHDRTADALAKALSGLPHCNVTIVPFHVDAEANEIARATSPATAAPEGDGGRGSRKARRTQPATIDLGDLELPDERTPISEARFRQHVKVSGKVYSMRVQPWAGIAALELTLIDDTGALTVVFFGRKRLGGVKVGTAMTAEGTIGEHQGRMAMLNPAYVIHTPAPAPPPAPH